MIMGLYSIILCTVLIPVLVLLQILYGAGVPEGQ
jgi:hypothetical protein